MKAKPNRNLDAAARNKIFAGSRMKAAFGRKAKNTPPRKPFGPDPFAK